jgi:hypothetical protein
MVVQFCTSGRCELAKIANRTKLCNDLLREQYLCLTHLKNPGLDRESWTRKRNILPAITQRQQEQELWAIKNPSSWLSLSLYF